MPAKKITLTPSQTRVLGEILNFIDNPAQRVFILKGYAGTGKTTCCASCSPSCASGDACSRSWRPPAGQPR
ncbi:MAG: hypothetical protein IJT30_11285 [Muribaculaceae bacterium]|nr:hypothetical protein [Muribaculaceae bacterium]